MATLFEVVFVCIIISFVFFYTMYPYGIQLFHVQLDNWINTNLVIIGGKINWIRNYIAQIWEPDESDHRKPDPRINSRLNTPVNANQQQELQESKEGKGKGKG